MSDVRLVVATPIDGIPESAMVPLGYAAALARLLADKTTLGIADLVQMSYPADLVRARSRAVRLARERGATHIFWLDNDTVPKIGTVGAMLATGYDVVGCPYPRKRVHFERLKMIPPDQQPEHTAYSYAYHYNEAPAGTASVQLVNGCVPVTRLSMGCMLTSMRALDYMTDFYREELWFDDVVDGHRFDGVALFQLMMTATIQMNGHQHRTLLSEDYSFCERYNNMAMSLTGFAPIQMLVTHPADHVGTHLFRGATEGLVYAR